ncbi:MAG: metallophosphoesterase [Isosphaeraceae bacterium]|nr:metallophosphoesterase [Isosphaeraceae bacterium]
MSREAWIWAGVGFGHCVITVWLFNVSHALGLDEQRIKRVKILLLAFFATAAGWLTWEASSGPWRAWSIPAQFYAAVCLASGLIGFPVANLARILRRTPAGIAERTEEVGLKEVFGDEPPIGRGKHAWMLRLPGNESLRLRRRDWQVTLPGLPAAWDGLRLVHISDLHFAPCFERRFFETVAQAARSWDADLVLFTGDLIDHDETIDWVVPVLSSLRGRLGNYAILGNHDVTHRPDRILSELERAGFTHLDGRWERLEIGGRTLALGGTSHPWGPLPELGGLPEADFRLLMSHTPDLLYRASRWGIDLMLSGHNHGGQIRLPGIGPVFMPSVYSRRFDRGFFRAGGTLLHVSQGVSGMHPLRYGCVPEVSRLVLRLETSAHRPRMGQRSEVREADGLFTG